MDKFSYRKIKFEYRFTIYYLLFGAFLILVADKTFLKITDNTSITSLFQTIEAWLFLIVSSILFYSFIRIHLKNRRKYEKRIRDSNRLKTAFLQNISHEIRTPMNGIIGFSELLNDENISQKQTREYINIIKNSSYQLLSVINDIIDISQIESGVSELNEDIINLNEMIVDMITMFKPQSNAIDIDLAYSCELDIAQSNVMIDSGKIKQVFTKLINNAIKFTKQGSITIGYSIKETKIEFFVKDTGLGIAQELIPYIFDRFYKTESYNNIINHGTGLGLAICKAYIEKMNGNIRVESEVEKGSIFIFTIPYKKIEKIQSPQKADNISLNDKHYILIAEDNDLNYLYLKELFKTTKMTVLRALNGKDAVEQCRNNYNISLVLMDIKMPILSGIYATEMIKLLRPNLPVIMQTAYAMEKDYTEGKRVGCDAYLSKPINKEKLLSVVDSFLK